MLLIKTIYIKFCWVKININVHIRSNNLVRQAVHTKLAVIVLSEDQIMILVYYISLSEWDFLFKSVKSKLILFTYFVNHNLRYIVIKNKSNETINIFCNLQLRSLSKINFNNCYYINENSSAEMTDLITRKPSLVHYISWVKKAFAALIVIFITNTLNLNKDVKQTNETHFMSQTTLTLSEIILINDVTLHSENSVTVRTLTKVVNNFSEL